MNGNESLDGFVKFSRAWNSVQAALKREAVLPDSLGETAFGILEALYHRGPLCQNALGRKILKTKGRIAQTIDSLEKQGLVEKRTDPEDRRFFTVDLTPGGRELISGLFPRMEMAIEKVFSVLSREEKRELAHLCRKLGTGLEALNRQS